MEEFLGLNVVTTVDDVNKQVGERNRKNIYTKDLCTKKVLRSWGQIGINE